MANVFLNKNEFMDRDIETALLLSKAIITDIELAVAYTDGDKVFINTDDNLTKILPYYDIRMLKWILWHEEYHIRLRHHNRFFRYLADLDDKKLKDKFNISKEELNIIMDILVHDSLSKMFPELIDIAAENLAQFRNRNSLGYTFKTYTLEKMLDEYNAVKESKESKESDGKSKAKKTEEKTKTEPKSEHIGDTKTKKESKPTEKTKTDDSDSAHTKEPGGLPDEHDKTDWSKLKDRDSKEFIDSYESDAIQRAVEKLKRKRFKLAKLTETLNGLVTSTRTRTYAKPSSIQMIGRDGRKIILKGSKPGRTQLYIIFDASGSMHKELNVFKDIIQKSIPQALDMPCEWFAGERAKIDPYDRDYRGNYYKGSFKDIIPVLADDGYNDDGDRVIQLCLKAEQQGFTPIGVTDGGGKLSWSKPMLKQLKRTVLVGHRKDWLDEIKEVNPSIQTLHLDV